MKITEIKVYKVDLHLKVWTILLRYFGMWIYSLSIFFRLTLTFCSGLRCRSNICFRVGSSKNQRTSQGAIVMAKTSSIKT